MIFPWPRDWNPPHVVAWRALWFVPYFVLRVALVAVAACGWGRSPARSVWRDTR